LGACKCCAGAAASESIHFRNHIGVQYNDVAKVVWMDPKRAAKRNNK
jgi:hypothetical protein